jgi:hypothetical protein
MYDVKYHIWQDLWTLFYATGIVLEKNFPNALAKIPSGCHATTHHIILIGS